METSAVELFKKVLELQEKDSSKIALYLVVIVTASILSIITNLLIQLIITRKSYKQDISKMRIERRLKSVESLYASLSGLSNSISTESAEKVLACVVHIRRWISNNQILLGKASFHIANEILDYYSVVLSNPKIRNIKNENCLFLKYIKEYEDI